MTRTTLCFEQYNADGALYGIFIPPDTKSWDDTQEAFYNIEETTEFYDEYIYGMESILKKEPFFLDAYDGIGTECYNAGATEQAEKNFRAGLNIAEALMPPGFKGEVPYIDLDNRPFLRLHHGLVLCLLKKGQIKQAIKEMHQHLEWNPNDNIGVRFLLQEACENAGLIHIKYNILQKTHLYK